MIITVISKHRIVAKPDEGNLSLSPCQQAPYGERLKHGLPWGHLGRELSHVMWMDQYLSNAMFDGDDHLKIPAFRGFIRIPCF